MFRFRVDDEIELRYSHVRHARPLFALVQESREHLARFLRWPDRVRTAGDMREHLRADQRRLGAGDRVDTLIWYRGRLAGGLSLTLVDGHHGDIGYWLGKAFTGRGIMTRAVRALVDYGFRERLLHRITIRCATDNPRSSAIARRLGFEREVTQRQVNWMRDHYATLDVYSMRADAWRFTYAHPVFAHPLDETFELRLHEPRHARAHQALLDANRDHVGRWEAWVAHEGRDLQGARDFIRYTLRRYARGRGFATGIWRRGEGGAALVGSASLAIEGTNRVAEIGYWLAAAYTGRGLATWTGQALIDHAFAAYDCHRARIVASTGNSKSRAVAERLGFKLDCIQQQASMLRGGFVDRAIYSLLQHEWESP